MADRGTGLYRNMNNINKESSRVMVRDMETRSNPPVVVVSKKAVSNELLANIMRGINYGMVDSAIVDVASLTFSGSQVSEARRVIFKNFYNLFPMDPNGENNLTGAESEKEQEIVKKLNIEDLLEKMHVIASIEHDIDFCVPWDHKYVIVKEEDMRFRDIIKEKDSEIDAKFSSIEKVINKQNKATIMAVENIITESMDKMKDFVYDKKHEISSPILEEAEIIKGSYLDVLEK